VTCEPVDITLALDASARQLCAMPYSVWFRTVVLCAILALDTTSDSQHYFCVRRSTDDSGHRLHVGNVSFYNLISD